MRRDTVALEPRLYDGCPGFIISALAILSWIGIGRRCAALFSDGAKYQLREQVVALLICLADDVAERIALLISNLKRFLRSELVIFRNAKVATAHFAIHLDATRDQRLFEKRGSPTR